MAFANFDGSHARAERDGWRNHRRKLPLGTVISRRFDDMLAALGAYDNTPTITWVYTHQAAIASSDFPAEVDGVGEGLIR